ncbi:MAG: lytic transglycosylase domain-containing protein [Desulfobacterales bacterium]|uniref:Lytic transglycosylase domain-containing protein n=1 Tax=Candidatus Desulfatibia profunda TaxID=2841695 RepID=A0A8J6TNI8_9BACT|nr:lytic transglycosylase domain-containing protein [Candidatus Desulfatibia profunda]MBL7181268.1 lytic transglycosylase domain-containing protein [Desulfobacterales bacterium]MBU0699020.1 lytic transglycosylase domain-containing protein [Pseudomonadota bacterium]
MVLRNLVCWLFIVVVIIGISAVKTHKKQKKIRTVNKKIVTVKIQSPSPLTQELFETRPEYNPASVFLKKAEQLFHPIIVQAANRYQVDAALIKAIIMAESGYNPMAISKRGAIGLMQLMPDTAESLGVEDSFNPKHNIDGGVRYFKQLVLQFDGNVKLALAAYNAGSSNVRFYQGIPPFKATQFYIQKVFKFFHIYKNRKATETGRA